MENPHITQIIKKYSDGTETVVNFKPNPNAAEIEAQVAKAVENHIGESVEEVFSEPISSLEEEVAVNLPDLDSAVAVESEEKEAEQEEELIK